MAQAPTLETPRLLLVPFTELHLSPRYIAWLNDIEVVRYSELRHRSHTLESCREYLHTIIHSPNYFWAITTREAVPGHIGNISVYVDEPNQVADIGLLIGEKSVWGQGYGSEAWCAVCDFLLHRAGLRKITAGTMASNVGMRAVMRHAGMVEEGRRQQQFLLDGRPEDLVLGALFSSSPESDI